MGGVTEIVKVCLLAELSILLPDLSAIEAIPTRLYSLIELKVSRNEADSVPELEVGVVRQTAELANIVPANDLQESGVDVPDPVT